MVSLGVRWLKLKNLLWDLRKRSGEWRKAPILHSSPGEPAQLPVIKHPESNPDVLSCHFTNNQTLFLTHIVLEHLAFLWELTYFHPLVMRGKYLTSCSGCQISYNHLLYLITTTMVTFIIGLYILLWAVNCFSLPAFILIVFLKTPNRLIWKEKSHKDFILKYTYLQHFSRIL
jgi:hypothetical protein